MSGKQQQLADGHAALAAPQSAAALPRRRSSPSISLTPDDDSAAVTSAAHNDHTMPDASHLDPGSDSESSVVSSSSEEPSSDEDEDSEDEALDDESGARMDTEEITALPLPPDPETRRKIYQRQAPPPSTLSDRLKAFLPQLAAANEELERDRATGKLAQMSLENVGDDEERYIEMNLGLGVLKERDPNRMDSDSESDDEPADAMDTDADGQQDKKTKEEDILGKLMGRKKAKAGPGIQEVPDQ
ncbi:hypothetical protein MPH_05823 [Macrophomina phaseolina MS6]|uniref:Uncharacterized protein n=1 Tax=Macrophomina phaseolina (strain MS6) TaxID=1126212 RepID=K2RWB3_MACPH|nr:hypothetical protein MPH_05823 [Macrophomina phaseolina MS6]